MQKAAASVSLALLLAACEPFGDPFGDVCFNCVSAPANAPLAATDAAQLRLIHGGSLPAGAANVYYRELCGIDCIQWVRFDIADTQWDEFVVQMRAAAPNQVSPGQPETGSDDMPAWWRERSGSPLEHMKLMGQQGWPVTLTGYELPNDRIRVFLVAHEM
jgi:hypothetical protein